MKRFVAIAALLILGVSARAEVTEDRISQLEQRLQKLETAPSALKESLGAKFGEHRLGLLLQLWAVHDESKAGLDLFRGRRAEIKFSGELSPRLLYALMLDPVGLQGTGGRIVQDYYIGYSLCSASAFRFGQFKYPQGLEGRTSVSELDFVERALVSGKFGDRRDFTAEIAGSKVKLASVAVDYAVGAVQGAGRNASENNDDKDLAARLGAQAGPVWIGVSGYRGHQPTGLRDRLGAEARAVIGKAKVQGEYIHGRDEPAAAGPSTPSAGYYVMTNYRVGAWRGGLRWESLDPSRLAASDRMDALTLGLDLFSAGDHSKISLNYTLNGEEGTDVSNDLAAAQFQVYF